MDLENFPTRESAKDMLSMVSPIYDRSYVGKWIFQVMAAPDCAETKHKTPYESVPYCSPGGRNFRAGG